MFRIDMIKILVFIFSLNIPAVADVHAQYKLPADDSSRFLHYRQQALRQPLYSHLRDAYLDSALAIKPNDAYLWLQKENPVIKQRKYDLGIRYLDSAVKYDPQQFLPYRAFTKCIFQKNYADALEDFRKTIALYGDGNVMDHSYDFYIGLCHLQLNQYDSALIYIAHSVDQQQQTHGSNWVHPMEWFYLGIVQHELNNDTACASSLTKCLKIYPKFPYAQYYLGILQEQALHFDKALALVSDAWRNMQEDYTFSEDSAIYEPFPYQVSRHHMQMELKWLQEQVSNGTIPGGK